MCVHARTAAFVKPYLFRTSGDGGWERGDGFAHSCLCESGPRTPESIPSPPLMPLLPDDPAGKGRGTLSSRSSVNLFCGVQILPFPSIGSRRAFRTAVGSRSFSRMEPFPASQSCFLVLFFFPFLFFPSKESEWAKKGRSQMKL